MSHTFTNHPIKEQIINDNKPFPFVINNTDIESKQDFLAWINHNKENLKDLTTQYDAVLFRNFPIHDSLLFEQMLDESDFPMFDYIGGAAPRNKVTAGRILTANESPATEDIPFHHEMAQTPNPPNNIFFYCSIPAEQGGATPIIQSNMLYQTLLKIAPDYAKYLEKVGVKYIRVMPNETDMYSAIGRSWKETFKCQSKSEAEKVMKSLGYEWQWLENDMLKTITDTLPAIKVDKTSGQKVFFNSIIAVYQGWNDSRNVGKKSVITGDGQYIDEQIIEKLINEIKPYVVSFKWHKNDVIWINNNKVLHSREPYVGERKICASLA